MCNKMTFNELLSYIKELDGVLLLTHKRPDGDTLGCAAGLCAILRKLGKTAFVLDNPEATPLNRSYILPYLAPADFQPESIVAVDTASLPLFPAAAKNWLEKGVTLAIDHHTSHRDYSTHNYVDVSAAACGEIIYQLAEALGLMDAEIAIPLYVAVSTDTGCFVYANTTPQTHQIAAALMMYDINYVNLNRLHFQTKSFRRMKLEGMLIDNMHLYDEGRLAVTVLTMEMLEQLQAVEEDAEDIAPVIASLEGAQTTITLREIESTLCKVSVRTTTEMNANDICAQVGGGGHPGAAGALLRRTAEQSEELMVSCYFTVKGKME